MLLAGVAAGCIGLGIEFRVARGDVVDAKRVVEGSF